MKRRDTIGSISGMSSTWLAWSMELPTRRRADPPLPADWIWEKIRKETMTAISALARDIAPVRHSLQSPFW